MSGSISLRRSCKKPIANPSARLRQWCSLMASGSICKPSKKASKKIAVSARGTRNRASAWGCWSRSACGLMGAANGTSSMVYQATSASEARVRLIAFGERWRATQSQAVATFEREFEQTIRYYSLEGMVRELRRKFRQVSCFGSPSGTQVAVYIQVTRLNAQWSKTSWWEVSHSLALNLLNINP